jgi:hypothetical protein
MKLFKSFSMKIRKPATAIAFVAGMMVVLMQVQTAQAAVTNSLANLVSTGGTLTIDDKTFSGFSLLESGLSGFDANSILVTASVDPSDSTVDFLTFSGNMQLAGASFATADLLLGYTVTANPGSIFMIDQRYTGGVFNGGVIINETATSAGAPTAHSQLTISDVSDPNAYPGHPGDFDTGELDLLAVNPAQTTLNVTKDLAFVIISGDPGTVSQSSVSLVQQSFHQVAVPEPTSIGLVVFGLVALAGFQGLKRKNTFKIKSPQQS